MRKFLTWLFLLLIVRAWNPRTGELVVRLPMHAAILHATLKDRAKPPKLKEGEVIHAKLLADNQIEIKGRTFRCERLEFEGE
jgi:hypothetical protein